VGSIHKLIIEDDEGKTTVVPVSRGEISIGRMEGNTIRLMERNVSRRHARLLRESGAVFIEDLNSFNGVKINGERIDKRLEVKEGDLVEIGDYHLALQSVEVEDEAPNRAETVVQPPRLPEPTGGLPPPHANGKNEAWRQMATVPAAISAMTTEVPASPVGVM
jgi:pSer/pThr/pTyr-binding forkhead associated (FHA) protein